MTNEAHNYYFMMNGTFPLTLEYICYPLISGDHCHLVFSFY